MWWPDRAPPRLGPALPFLNRAAGRPPEGALFAQRADQPAHRRHHQPEPTVLLHLRTATVRL
eukprot:5931186-Prymnesium_polylepis.1